MRLLAAVDMRAPVSQRQTRPVMCPNTLHARMRSRRLGSRTMQTTAKIATATAMKRSPAMSLSTLWITEQLYLRGVMLRSRLFLLGLLLGLLLFVLEDALDVELRRVVDPRLLPVEDLEREPGGLEERLDLAQRTDDRDDLVADAAIHQALHLLDGHRGEALRILVEP